MSGPQLQNGPTREEIQQADDALRLAMELIAAGNPEGYLLRARAYAVKHEWREGIHAYSQAMKHALRSEYLPYARDLQIMLDHQMPLPRIKEQMGSGSTTTMRRPIPSDDRLVSQEAPAPRVVRREPPAPQPVIQERTVTRTETRTVSERGSLEEMVETLVLTQQPEPMKRPDLDRAERAFVLGQRLYFTGEYFEAEKAFHDAVRCDHADARHWYFLGLAQFAQGKSADAAFKKGGELEARGLPNSREVGLALEGINGPGRKALQSHRP